MHCGNNVRIGVIGAVISGNIPAVVQRHYLLCIRGAILRIECVLCKPAGSRCGLILLDRKPCTVLIRFDAGNGTIPECILIACGIGHFYCICAIDQLPVGRLMACTVHGIMAQQQIIMRQQSRMGRKYVIPGHIHMVPRAVDQQHIPCVIERNALHHHGIHTDTMQQQTIQPRIALAHALVTQQHAIGSMAQIRLRFGFIFVVIVIKFFAHPFVEIQCLFGIGPCSIHTGNRSIHLCHQGRIGLLIHIIFHEIIRRNRDNAVALQLIGHGILFCQNTDIPTGYNTSENTAEISCLIGCDRWHASATQRNGT